MADSLMWLATGLANSKLALADAGAENGEWAYLGISGNHHSITGYGNGAGAIGYTYIRL